jgi:tRNA pseudouridine38-40 synthase
MELLSISNWNYYKAIVSYQGTYFQGWQSQPHKNTIQDCIELVLYDIFNKKQKIIGASRTDSGVHAYGQVFLFQAPMTISIEKLLYIINMKLPDTIVIHDITSTSRDFHPRYLAKKKIYQYLFSPKILLPSLNFFILYYPRLFDLNKLNDCFSIFKGTHDFKSFCALDYEKNTVRTIYDINIKCNNDIYIITIIGNGFLRYMIRRLLGAALQVATKDTGIDEIRKIFELKNSNHHLMTLPAQGLILKEIIYNEDIIVDFENPFLKEISRML